MLDVQASGAAYIGNNYETDLIGTKRAGIAMAGLIHQTEDQKKTYSDEFMPYFNAEDLKGPGR